MNVSLRTILIASFVTLITITALLTGYLSYRNGRMAVNDAVAQLRSEIARQINNRLQAQMEIPALINRINATAISQGFLPVDDPRAMERFFWQQIRDLQAVSSIYFANTRGGLADAGREGNDEFLYVIATDDFEAGAFRKYATDDAGNRGELLLTVPDFDARTRPWYQRARDIGGPAWSDIYVLFTGQDMAIAASRPVYDASGELIGVTATDIFLSRLNDYLQGLSIGRTGEAFIVEPTGELVATSTGEPLFTDDGGGGGWRRVAARESANALTRAAHANAVNGPGNLAGLDMARPLEFEMDDRRYFAQVTPFRDEHGLDWRTVVVIPESDFMAKIHENTRWTAALIAATIALAIVAGVIGSRRISDPLVRLSAAARTLSRGEQTNVPAAGRIREIDALSTAFNTMATQMHELVDGLRNEVIEREQVETELRHGEALYRSVVENIREIAFQTDARGRWTYLNPSWTKLTGLEIDDVLGRSFLDHVHPDDRNDDLERFRNIVEGRQAELKGEMRMLHRNGGTRWMQVYARATFNDAGEIIGTAGTLADVTERMQVDRAVRRMQKMEAIGRLSGGIAHDFNNLLAIILGSLDLMERRGDLDESTRQSLAPIRKSAQRAEKLTRQLLGFSRRQATESRACDVNELVRGMEQLFARSITPQINLRLDLADDSWPTSIDPGDFEDALLNLVVNARDAMPDGGTLTITTRNRTLDNAFCALNPAAKPGEHVEVAVVDTGIGVSLEILDHIFEPFFTTKTRDKGTGLGLAMVYGFVKRSGGYIRVDSTPGAGTEVCIYLPRLVGELVATPSAPVDDELSGGSETILVVDDEEELRELARTLLTDLGYSVITAANGAGALTKLDENPGIDLVFSDVVMPGGMSGYELAEAATAAHPGIRVLLTSGYTERTAHDGAAGRSDANVLRKPYSPVEIARHIRRVLDSSPVS